MKAYDFVFIKYFTLTPVALSISIILTIATPMLQRMPKDIRKPS